jgi:hypothetical protein
LCKSAQRVLQPLKMSPFARLYETPEAFNFFLPPEAFFPPAARGIFNTETHRNHIYYFYGNFLRLNFGASVNARLDFGGRWWKLIMGGWADLQGPAQTIILSTAKSLTISNLLNHNLTRRYKNHNKKQ